MATSVTSSKTIDKYDSYFSLSGVYDWHGWNYSNTVAVDVRAGRGTRDSASSTVSDVAQFQITTPNFTGSAEYLNLSMAVHTPSTWGAGSKTFAWAIDSAEAGYNTYRSYGDIGSSYAIAHGTFDVKTTTAATMKTVTLSNAGLSALQPNTTYYLYIHGYTNGSSQYLRINKKDYNISFSIGYNKGIVYIDNGSGFVAYQPYIDTGSGWSLYMPYIDTGTGWTLY